MGLNLLEKILPGSPQPVYTEDKPTWQDQVEDKDELEVGELYELWWGDEEKLVDIVQVMEEPQEDSKGRVYVPVYRFRCQGDRHYDPEDFLYLHQLSIVPAQREGEDDLWWNGNHLKKHESSVYKEMVGKLTAEEEEAVRYVEMEGREGMDVKGESQCAGPAPGNSREAGIYW